MNREQLEKDRELRDSARALFHKELGHVRNEIAPQALGERAADRIGEKVDNASDNAIGFARKHGGVMAAVGGAIATAVGLWFARKPLLDKLNEARKPNGAADEEMNEEAGDE